MKKLFLILFLFCSCTALNAQDGYFTDSAQYKYYSEGKGAVKTAKGIEDYPLAIKNFTAAINENPKFVNAYGRRAMMYVYQGKNKEALDDLQTALKINPARADLYFEMASIKRDEGNQSEMAKYLALATAQKSTSLINKLGVAKAYALGGNYTEARKVCEDAMYREYQLHSNLLVEATFWESKALKDLKKQVLDALKKATKDRNKPYATELSRLYGCLDLSSSYWFTDGYLSAINLSPSNPLLYEFQGYVQEFAGSGFDTNSFPGYYYAKAAKIYGDNGNKTKENYLYARAEYFNGHYPKALEYIKKVPEGQFTTGVNFLKAKIYAKLGDFDNAYNALAKLPARGEIVGFRMEVERALMKDNTRSFKLWQDAGQKDNLGI